MSILDLALPVQRLKTLGQYTTTITRDGVQEGASAEQEDNGDGGSDMTDRFKNLFSF